MVRNLALLDEDRLDFGGWRAGVGWWFCTHWDQARLAPAASPRAWRSLSLSLNYPPAHPPAPADLLEALVAHIDEEHEGEEGAILVFLPGARC